MGKEMNCHDFKDKAFDFLFNLLSVEDAESFEEHAVKCSDCSEELEKARRQRAAFDEWQPAVRDTADLTDDLMDRLSRRADVFRLRRMRVVKTVLATAACIALLLFSFSLFEPALPDVDLRISGPAMLVPGEGTVYRVLAYDTSCNHLTEPGRIDVFLSDGTGRKPIPAEYEEGKGLVVHLPESTAEGDAELVFTYEDGEISRAVKIGRPQDIFISTDRACYAVGDTARMKALVRDSITGEPVIGRKVTFILREMANVDSPVLMKTEQVTNEYGVALAEGVLSRSGRVSVEASLKGKRARKSLQVADKPFDSDPGSKPGMPRQEFKVACLPDGGVILKGRRTRFHVYTSWLDGTPLSCNVMVGAEKIRTDGQGYGSLDLTPTDDFKVIASLDSGRTEVIHLLEIAKFKGNLAVIPERAVLNANEYLSIRIVSTNRQAEVAMLDVFRNGRLIKAVEVPLTRGEGRVNLETSEEDSGTLRLVGYIGLDARTRGNRHARNVYVRPARRLQIAALAMRRLPDGRIEVPLRVTDENGLVRGAAIAARVEIPGNLCTDIHEIARLNRQLLGLEFSIDRKDFMGARVTDLHSGGSDVVLARGVDVMVSELSLSSRKAALHSFEKRRRAMASWLGTLRFGMFPILLVVIALIVLGKNVISVLRPSFGERCAHFSPGWVSIEAGMMLLFGSFYFTAWSLLSGIDTAWHVQSLIYYPLGMLVAMAASIRVGAHLRQKRGTNVDTESRLVELGVLMAVFLPTQFFGPNAGWPRFLNVPEFYAFSANSILFFIVIVGGLALVRGAAPRRRAILRYSPVLVAAALILVVGVNFLAGPSILIDPDVTIVSPGGSARQSEVLYWNGDLRTDENGHAVIILPAGTSLKGKVDITLEGLSTDGRRGVLQEKIELP